MILFVDDVADNLGVPNTTVIVLEKEHGIMDVIRWIEVGRFEITGFDIVSIMIGRHDVRRRRSWFKESMEEFITLVKRLNSNALVLIGAVIPAIQDDRDMVREFWLGTGHYSTGASTGMTEDSLNTPDPEEYFWGEAAQFRNGMEKMVDSTQLAWQS